MACPMLDLSEAEAVREVKRIHERDRQSPVLKKCISCFACAQACPEGLNLHDLVLSLWHERRPGLAVPWQARLFLPEQRPPNAWTAMQRYYSPVEREMHGRLLQEVRGREALYLGCNQLLNLGLFASPLFRSLPMVGAPGVCCGEPYFRMGFMEAFRASARRWLEHFRERAPSRLVVVCTPCLNMLKNVYPAYLQESPPFEVIGALEWLDERLNSGELPPPEPRKMKVMIQDSCHARVLGDDFLRRTRSLIKAAGLEIIGDESRHSDCCGFAGAAARFNPLTMYGLAAGRLKEARKSGAEAVVTYCNGCLLMLSMAERLYPFRVEVRHLLDLLEPGPGGERTDFHRRRAGQIMTAAFRTAVMKTAGAKPNVLDLSLDHDDESKG